MYYSSFGILAVIHHVIINYDVLKNGRKGSKDEPRYRYWQFLNALLIFYLTDLLWGFLAESNIRPLAYADTMLFFASMALSVLLWTRYVVAFLNKKDTLSIILSAAGWGIFGFVIFHLGVNFFNPVIFTFTKDMEYIPGSGRYFLLAAQFIMFILTTVYSFFTMISSEGRDKVHYRAVCSSSGVMAVFIVLQSFDPFAPFYTIGCLFANCLLHVFVEEDEKTEQDRITAHAQKEKERYSQIANSLAKDYEAIYYINIETGNYIEISASESYEEMNIPKTGEDFYKDARENVRKFVHPDERDFAETMYSREAMLKNIEGRKSYSYKYRIMTGDEARYYRFVVILSNDGKHFVLCDKDINDTITAETALLEKQKINITFSQIAESLASNYDEIYYVDTSTGKYVSYTANNIYGELEVDQSGDDFFADTVKNISRVIHPKDRDRMVSAMNRDAMLTALEERKQFNIEYRLIVNDQTRFARLSSRKSSDGIHFIIGVENIDDEKKKEREHLKALNTEKELARRDELTGTKNKTAFTELEQSVQNNIESGMDYLPFAIAVCDLNDLKKINDSQGHKAGDEYIRSSAKLLCNIFDHSPIFRIGGDEFAIFLRGDDYTSRNELIAKLHRIVESNLENHNGPVIAIGMAEYDPSSDTNVNEIFERADHLMYEDKRELKQH